MSEGKQLQNRIVGHEEVEPDQLLAHPENWRIHSGLQQRDTEKAMEHVGWVDDVTVNKNTGRVVDGHMRIAISLRRGEAKVPVKYVDLSEEEERFVLRTLDPLGELAIPDVEKLKELHETVLSAGHLTDVLDELMDASSLSSSKISDREDSSPDEFPEFDDSIETEFECPKCGYAWSGKKS